MNANDLLDIIGDARPVHVAQAQTHRRSAQTSAPPQARRLSIRRPLFVAAVILLLLALVGCTVAVIWSLQDLTLEEHTATEPAHFDKEGNWVEETNMERQILSLQGFAGSLNQQALIEWRAFLDSYDPDGTLRKSNVDSPSGLPQNYCTVYHCYTQEMAEKLDEIAEKYDLSLYQSHLDVNVSAQFLLDTLELDGWLYTDTAAVEYSGYGELYDNGSFEMAARITLAEGWTYPTWLSLNFSYKDCFDPNTQVVENLDSFRQWNYRTTGGTDLLLAMNDDYALIIADREDAFVTVNLESFYRQKNINAPDFNQITYMAEADLEQIAEGINFSIHPRVEDMVAARRELTDLEVEQEAALESQMETYVDPNHMASFSDIIRYRLEHYADPEDIYYALWDLNGDGQEELFIGSAEDGSFGEVVWMVDGETQVNTLGFLEGIYLCEGNILEWSDPTAGRSPGGVDDKRWFVQFTPEGSQQVDWIALSYARDPENPWFTDTSGFGTTWGWEPITEEEYNAVLEKYIRIEVETFPITESPLE